MMWIIHGYHPYPQKSIHHPWIFIRMHLDASMVVPNVLPLLTSVPSPGITPTANNFYTNGLTVRATLTV
jgi:hypothetical protein